MYLKVAGLTTARVGKVGSEEECGMKADWYMIEGKRMRWKLLKEPVKSFMREHADRKIMNNHNCSELYNSDAACSECSPPDKVVEAFLVHVFGEDGKEYVVMFDTFGFILNDKGDTIERLSLY